MVFTPPYLLTKISIYLVIVILLFSPVFLVFCGSHDLLVFQVRYLVFCGTHDLLVFSPVFLVFCVFLPVKNSLFLDNYLYLCRHY